ncbi:MAG: CRTAC1 family protein [Chloroflexota bacterium]|nr:MAG: CRTAC1 family protein [Chloroflexota bacterium]
MRRTRLVAILLAGLLAACAGSRASPTPSPNLSADAQVRLRPLTPPVQPCNNTFVTRPLDYTTLAAVRPVGLYESNGAGLAVGDLDDDGDQDIVMANLGGPNTILWNEGRFRWRAEELSHGGSRGVTIVDVDGDGDLDIVFTLRGDRPSFFRNVGTPEAPRFEPGQLPDVNNPFYTINWADLEGDGDLDLVAASYDADLLKQQGLIFTQRGGVGVFVYEREGETYLQHRLADAADALAIALPDIDGDGRRDIWVGNDFIRPDGVWLWRNGGWAAATPFDSITENTMSLDLGDVDNDGVPELFAADMKPYAKDAATMARWLPMMKKMTMPMSADDPQHAENVLLVRGADGRWRNQGYERMVDSTGWSWSAKFGDLDRDGYLDLYVVNGMIAEGLFDHLPNHELVEANMVLRNNGRGTFHPMPEWGLGSTSSGRGMSMADFDGDGDLDIVVNNLESPAQLFENRLCGGENLLVDLRWPESANTRAIGAELRLHTSAGTFLRDVRAASGYLSGDSSQVHFGIPPGATIEGLTITWPDGAVSEVTGLVPQTQVTVTR